MSPFFIRIAENIAKLAAMFLKFREFEIRKSLYFNTLKFLKIRLISN